MNIPLEHHKPQFPSHSSPRVWFLTSGATPLATSLIRELLSHGDFVAAGVCPGELNDQNERSRGLLELLDQWPAEHDTDHSDQMGKLMAVQVDCRAVGQCQSAIATIIKVWGRLDILLCCTSEAVVGTVEELSQTTATRTLVREQFETNYFGMINIIQAVLPSMRENQIGHVLILTGIMGHIGTSALGMYCASSWALEGFCDSLAYEVAPFNVKMTIVQPNLEVNTLTNKITFAPAMAEYNEDEHAAPSIRDILRDAVDRASGHTETRSAVSSPRSAFDANEKDEIYPLLSAESLEMLVGETVYALAAIGGHNNPPARHIVGSEGVASVKEKLKTVSEELEDFVDASRAVDIFELDQDGIVPRDEASRSSE